MGIFDFIFGSKFENDMEKLEQGKISNEEIAGNFRDYNTKSINRDGWNPLIFASVYNKRKKLNLTEEEFTDLIHNSDLKIATKKGWTPLMNALIYNKEEGLNLTQEQFTYLIENSDLKVANEDGWSPLMFALIYNKEEGLNLTQEQFTYLIENSDLSVTNQEGWSPLMFAFRHNKEEGLNLTQEQFTYFIQNSDLSVTNQEGWSPLIFAFRHNKEEGLNLTQEQLTYLIENTDQKTIQKKSVNWGSDSLMYFLYFDNNIFLSDENFNLLLSKSNLSSKNANSEGQNWITLYLKADKKKRLPSNDYILSKIFEESIKDQKLLHYVTEQFFQRNEERLFCLKEKHFDFLISKLDFEFKKSDALLVRYINNKSEQKLELSESSLTKLISNISYKNEECLNLILEGKLDLTKEQWKAFIDNTPLSSIDFSTFKKLNELKENGFNIEEDVLNSFKLKLSIPTEEIVDILKDKITGTNKVDLSVYDSDRPLFFKTLVSSIQNLVREENLLFKMSFEHFNQERKEKLIGLVKKLNSDVGAELEIFLNSDYNIDNNNENALFFEKYLNFEKIKNNISRIRIDTSNSINNKNQNKDMKFD